MTNSGQSKNDAPQGKIIMEGLDSGTVIGIAFAAFVIGVMLTAALWYIHAHTGKPKTIYIWLSVCNRSFLDFCPRLVSAVRTIS